MSYYSKILTIIFSLLLLSCNKEFNSKEIKTLLGKPDLKDSTKNTFRYETFIDHGWNIDPQYFRGLEIYFNKDSIVTSVKIYEIKTR